MLLGYSSLDDITLTAEEEESCKDDGYGERETAQLSHLINELISKIGTPTNVGIFTSIKDMAADYYTDQSTESYALIWEFDDVVISIHCFDGVFYDSNTLKITNLLVTTPEYWEASGKELYGEIVDAKEFTGIQE